MHCWNAPWESKSDGVKNNFKYVWYVNQNVLQKEEFQMLVLTAINWSDNEKNCDLLKRLMHS